MIFAKSVVALTAGARLELMASWIANAICMAESSLENGTEMARGLVGIDELLLTNSKMIPSIVKVSPTSIASPGAEWIRTFVMMWPTSMASVPAPNNRSSSGLLLTTPLAGSKE